VSREKEQNKSRTTFSYLKCQTCDPTQTAADSLFQEHHFKSMAQNDISDYSLIVFDKEPV